jgi:superfamily II DNA or RNA helicase
MIDIESRSYKKYRSPVRAGRKYYNIHVEPDAIHYELDITNGQTDFGKRGFPNSRNEDMVRRTMVRITRDNEAVVQHKAWHFDVKEYRVYSVPTAEHMALYAAQMEIVHEASVNGKYEDSREALRTLTNLVKISEIPHLISEDFEGVMTTKQHDIVKLAKKNLDDGRSVIVFTQFVDMVRLIAQNLSTRVTNNVYMLHDKLNPNQRFTLIDSFRKQEGAACIVGTVNNLGKGFNLANADVIIMSDIPWSPLLYSQSVGRILRPDQEGNPEVFLVMNKYMIDMYKFDTIMSKLNMIKKHIDQDHTIKDEDTHKVDYQQFILDLLQKAIREKILELPESLVQNTMETGGI